MTAIPNTKFAYANRKGEIWTMHGASLREVRYYIEKQGYKKINLSTNGKQKTQRVHSIIAAMFIPKPEGKTQVCHRNDIKTDNRVENLYWGTQAENIKDAYRNGRRTRNSNSEKIAPKK